MAEEQWRQVRFTYLVADGMDVEAVEDRMLEACMLVVGCDPDADHGTCPSDWVGSSGPYDSEDI